MKMPDEIDEVMFAPCGMNCMVCYKHCNSQSFCTGCYSSEFGKPRHCRNCKIKDCIKTKEITYCFECENFPCAHIKALEKNYNNRYHVSLMQNSLTAQQNGVQAFLQEEQQKWTCLQCGGVISLHDGECTDCQQSVKNG